MFRINDVEPRRFWVIWRVSLSRHRSSLTAFCCTRTGRRAGRGRQPLSEGYVLCTFGWFHTVSEAQFNGRMAHIGPSTRYDGTGRGAKSRNRPSSTIVGNNRASHAPFERGVKRVPDPPVSQLTSSPGRFRAKTRQDSPRQDTRAVVHTRPSRQCRL